MLLTLEVVSANGEALGANRRKTVGPEGAYIGRAKENDWVIADQYISRVNARIHCMNGAFYIEGLGRNPLAMQDANNTVLNNQLQQLRDGDRFFLDQYEIQARISGQTAAIGQTQPNLPADDPFAPESPVVVRNPRPANVAIGNAGSGHAGIGNGGIGDVVIGAGGHSSGANLDPLAVLGVAESTTAPPPKPIDLNQGLVIEDHFRPQAPIPSGQTAPNGIPDDWLNDSKSNAPPQRPPIGQGRRPTAPPVAIPETWNKTGYTQLGQAQRPADPAIDVFPPNDSTVVEDITGSNDPLTSPRTEPQRPTQPARPQAPQPLPLTQPPPQRPAFTEPTEAQSSLGQLLHAAGLPSAQMTPEIASEIGEALRIVVQGVMDVLRSRAEIKSEMRMAMTRMQPQENNPLKFSPNVESALHTLLVERNRGYMPTTRAFQEAFNDIRNHQMAVLYGFRVAFDSLMAQFHPDHIETQMEAHGRRGGLLNIGSKGRFRDYYGEMFEQLTKDPEASFRHLFSEPFAQAYEEQMEELALAASRSKRRE